MSSSETLPPTASAFFGSTPRSRAATVSGKPAATPDAARRAMQRAANARERFLTQAMGAALALFTAGGALAIWLAEQDAMVLLAVALIVGASGLLSWASRRVRNELSGIGEALGLSPDDARMEAGAIVDAMTP